MAPTFQKWTSRPRRAGLAFLLGLLCAFAARAEDRVAAARQAKGAEVRALFAAAKVAYPPGEIYLRAFKGEGELELWAGPRGKPLTRVKQYPICASSGTLGPKRVQGDGQVPEGFYAIDRFNPWSNFHLSLGLDYPNQADRIRNGAVKLGGDIFIHGNCVTIGCMPITDAQIEELYLVALDARAAGQKRIPVHVFPRRMDAEGMAFLGAQAKEDAALLAFWKELEPAYAAFEAKRRPPAVKVDAKGRYRLVGQ